MTNDVAIDLIRKILIQRDNKEITDRHALTMISLVVMSVE